MRGSHLRDCGKWCPFGWVLDPEPLPPHAALPRLDAHSWEEVANFSQKERQLVLKVSGFHETAWGSRGVFIGHDLPAPEWSERLNFALEQSSEQPWILQEFREGRRIEHPVFRDDGSVEMMQGRVRLCPYFFTDDDGETTFGGCLATIVPADKKKIHGMTRGVRAGVVRASGDWVRSVSGTAFPSTLNSQPLSNKKARCFHRATLKIFGMADEIRRHDQTIPAFFRVTKAPFLLTVFSARQLSFTLTNLSSSGTQMRLFWRFGEKLRFTTLVTWRPIPPFFLAKPER